MRESRHKELTGNMAKLYYTAPSQEAFDEMKAAAIKVWGGYDEPYKSEKLACIANVQNVQDNFMYLFAMFDINNQAKVVQELSNTTREMLKLRMLDGGNEESYLQILGL